MSTNTTEFANQLMAENEQLKRKVAALESDAKLSIETLKNADAVVMAAKEKFEDVCVDNELLREQVQSALKDFCSLRQLCGYVEDGSDTTLKIYQDDATKTWFVQGVSNGYGPSISAAINDAAEGIESSAAPCCTPSPDELKLLAEGDFSPEELWGVGGKPSCPKCAGEKP